jgi:hypothetical protein
MMSRIGDPQAIVQFTSSGEPGPAAKLALTSLAVAN